MQKTKRLVALDVFRGLTIASMILVNTPGSWQYVYPPLRHAQWAGCTPTDLVFPFFLFIVGVAMWFSFKKYGRKLNKESVKKILKRTVLIFLIGLLFAAFPLFKDLAHIRVLGVFQRIALAYCFASLLVLSVKRNYLWLISLLVLFAYWALLYFLGGEQPYGLETNIVRKIDIAVLGESRLWTGFGIPFDPEGLLSTLPAVITVVIGYCTGRFIELGENKKKVVVGMLVFGVLGIIFGIFWGRFFPIIKALWTSSYVIYTAGWALLILGIFIYIIDVLNYKKWTGPFVVFGMNPLFAYSLSVIWVKVMIYLVKIPVGEGELMNGYSWLYHKICVPIAGNMNGSLLFGLLHIAFFWFILWILHKRKIYIKI